MTGPNPALSPEAVTPETKLQDILETEACTRCGGGGRYSWNQRDGDRCWGCNGHGYRRSKRAQAAIRLFEAVCSVPASAVRPGDRIRFPGLSYGWATVEEVVWNADAPSSGRIYYPDTEAGAEAIAAAEADPHAKVEYRERKDRREAVVWAGLNIKTTRVTHGATDPEKPVQVGLSAEPEVRLALYKTIAEYQLSLTKAGKPRKGSRWNGAGA